MAAAWAGNFECTACGRKRLIGSEFSKAALERHRRDPTAPLRCVACVEAAAAVERQAAADKQRLATADDAAGAEHVCSACARSLPAAAFNRNQLSKGGEKQRCQTCVADAEQAAAADGAEKYAARLAAARQAMQRAEASGSAAEKVVAASAYSAIEAEKVTGLKPVVLGRGRARGRGGALRGRARAPSA
ncbi:hypothetical protein KFE25_008615 [Diacronema lutheri]|uniref:Stc1 domain-containing protein n=1 Tax=Diacronema lutheri TaxID=2081491 RepID=A0A8J5Y2S6_DIALT|nr:hypothetical protein KFE25_008615 [Diacronema lutheri]